MLFRYSFPDLYYAHKVDDPATRPDSFSEHFHSLFEMLYFIDGDGEFLLGNKCFPLKSGDLIFTCPGTRHRIHPLSNRRYERYVIRFSRYLVPNDLLSSVESLEGCYNIGDTALPALFSRFDEHVANIGDNPAVLKMLFRCVLTEIIVYFNHMEAKGKLGTALGMDISAVLDYIDKNVDKPLCLDDICLEFHYSKSYICREFSQKTGTPIMKYVRNKKIMYADALLNSGMRPTEVAEWCGFSDYSTFFRMYKKLTGKAPSENKPQ